MLKKIVDTSKSRIPKPEKEVKGFTPLAEWDKEQLKKYKNRSLEGKNISDYGEYRVYFTRKTLKNDLGNLNYKEKLLRLAMELYRDKKSNIAYPPFPQLKELTGMSKDTLIRTIRSSEVKKVFKVERRKGDNNVYDFSI